MKTRSEHMQWCKDRALEYVRAGDGQEAMNSIISDLRKHEETESSVQLGFSLMMMTDANNLSEVEKFIRGFN